VTWATAAAVRGGEFMVVQPVGLGPRSPAVNHLDRGHYGHKKARLGKALVREKAAGEEGRVQTAHQDESLKEHEAETKGAEGTSGRARWN
jgi:hypothetical protein